MPFLLQLAVQLSNRDSLVVNEFGLFALFNLDSHGSLLVFQLLLANREVVQGLLVGKDASSLLCDLDGVLLLQSQDLHVCLLLHSLGCDFGSRR